MGDGLLRKRHKAPGFPGAFLLKAAVEVKVVGSKAGEVFRWGRRTTALDKV
jgi:hypothetical protein